MILRWFSHEVNDLEPVLSMIESQDPKHYQVSFLIFSMVAWYTTDMGNSLYPSVMAINNCDHSIQPVSIGWWSAHRHIYPGSYHSSVSDIYLAV